MGDGGTPLGAEGRYVLVAQVGSGATGTVHEARDTVLGRRVAVKIIDRRLAADPVFRARVVNEAEVLARLDGRAIVRVYDFGETDEGMYLVTEYLPDGDLGAWVTAHGPLTPRDAALLVADVCDALDQAHRAGVVHRDVKPGNVLVRSREEVLEGYLADFGIARPDDSELTVTGQVLGTARYMAPEQHEGARASAAGDLYSAGCVLWFALTGRPPYDGTAHQQAVGHIEGPVPQLEGGPGRINAVLARSMAKDPAARYATARDMAAALRAGAREAVDLARGGDTTIATPAPTPPTPGAERAPRRRRTALLVAALVLVVVAAGGAVWATSRDGDRWRCGDGSMVGSASECDTPRGAGGLTTVFPASRGCPLNTTNAAKDYAVACTFSGAPSFKILYSAWPSRAAALDHYRGRARRIRPAPAVTRWDLHGEDAGTVWTWDGATHQASFLYDDLDYSVSVSSDTSDGLAAAVAFVGRAASRPSELLPQKVR